MPFLPMLRLDFPGGAFNEYRVEQNHVEFRNGDGTWHQLTQADVRLHFVLHTEVAQWLRRETGNAQATRKVRAAMSSNPSR